MCEVSSPTPAGTAPPLRLMITAATTTITAMRTGTMIVPATRRRKVGFVFGGAS